MGEQKRVIFLDKVGSQHFREAYFVLNDDTFARETDLVEECKSILDNLEKSRRFRFHRAGRALEHELFASQLLAFFCGALLATVILSLFLLIG